MDLVQSSAWKIIHRQLMMMMNFGQFFSDGTKAKQN